MSASTELAANRRNIRPGRVIAWTLLILGGFLMALPILYMFSTSLKPASDTFDLRLIPAAPTLANYIDILQDGRFIRWFYNSMIIAVAVTASNVFFDSLVGYTLAKFDFRGKNIVFIAILSTLMIPTEMLVIPWYMMSAKLGWLDSHWGIMFPGMMTAFGTFLMKQFFEGVPNDFLEAARVDGLNEFTIWWKIAMPMVLPAISALAIFTFLGNWTAFLWPLISTTSPDLYTLPVGLNSFAVGEAVRWERIMTGAALATIPTLLVFLALQRFIVRGVMLAGLKG
ncbi:carbohydrate ABC transporter permease [Ketogulonicigenium vulgare]|uniref:sn-glycerol-3-phosphate transport system permease protein UgpE n=1 Tax=Ketogulonicigenium vulgare (strain WSH-001) TaxID=759362 RepID=F9YA70_KETVW|nr:carbohydrate ABC transporter permease [Ketogulonicigenium vulgare]ADO43187.1 binding-protein-dependent transport systems inner membrane component [Ketogulonicigenium vulgare Y25]AEM41481.1 Binding-protein-dependent transport systems inner membrane component [Ketogulonicigenium vulgare WSH-001]ALJ81614.1 sugar ABC transporter permease [Ketogulonicigenium vulgare]ANW34290.1 sugar ABC transporter permease [Ketogulonicigenium vulgare]AOZ55223.1 binding-protein-dependent transporters inner membr